MLNTPKEGLVQSLQRGVEIVELLAGSGDGLALRDIAQHVGLKTPTVHNLLRTLVAAGWVEKVARPVRYRIADHFCQLSRQAGHGALAQRAAEVLVQLAGVFPALQFIFAQRIGPNVVTVLRVTPDRPGVVERPQGAVLHAYSTASGLGYQAFAGFEERQEYRARHPFWEQGAALWQSPQRLEEFLDQARLLGYVALQAPQEALAKMAVPLGGGEGELLGLLGASGPAPLSEETRRACIEQLQSAAEQLAPTRHRQTTTATEHAEGTE